MSIKFEFFEKGQYAAISKTFMSSDFPAFANLSMDRNLLHHDEAYASSTEFGRCIVPLGLSVLPFSALAGMAFPGLASLIVQQKTEAVEPVFYGEKIHYSARIVETNEALKVLRLSLVAFKTDARKIVLRSEMTVKFLGNRTRLLGGDEFRVRKPRKVALVTGASGHIGQAIAYALAKEGWDLILPGRSQSKLEEVKRRCEKVGRRVEVMVVDFTDVESVRVFAEALSGMGDASPSVVVHAASAGIADSIHDLSLTNFGALQTIVDALLIHFMKQQYGRIIFIGSTSQLMPVEGMDTYAAAKNMASFWLKGIDRFNFCNIQTLTLAPERVDTPFSDALPTSVDNFLLQPEDVADGVLRFVQQSEMGCSFATLGAGGIAEGRFDFRRSDVDHVSPGSQPTCSESGSERRVFQEPFNQNPSGLRSEFRKFFELGNEEDVTGLKIGGLATWDSLKHIELILRLESVFGISFLSHEIEETYSFLGLEKLVNRKLGQS